MTNDTREISRSILLTLPCFSFMALARSAKSACPFGSICLAS